MGQILPTIKKWFSNKKKEDNSIESNEVKWLKEQQERNHILVEKQKQIKALVADINTWNNIKNDKDKSYEYLNKYSSLFEDATIMPSISMYKVDNIRYCMDNPDKIVYKEMSVRKYPGSCVCGKPMGHPH